MEIIGIVILILLGGALLVCIAAALCVNSSWCRCPKCNLWHDGRGRFSKDLPAGEHAAEIPWLICGPCENFIANSFPGAGSKPTSQTKGPGNNEGKTNHEQNNSNPERCHDTIVG
jgi:hypothetical protein